MTVQIFSEAIDLSEATLDSTNRILRDVVLIRAGESANGRDYPAAVLQASVPVFEGVKAYADHPSRSGLKERAERSIRDITGWYTEVRFDGDALRANRIFANTQAGRDALAIAEDIVSGVAPKGGAGLSINAMGQARKAENGKFVVESITFAHSVDDVTTPAAGGSYLESVAGDALMTALVEAMTYEEWVSLRPAFTERYEQSHRKVRRNADLDRALAEVDQYRTRCEQLEAGQAALQEALDKTSALAETKAREVLVLRALTGKKLPAEWRTSLERTLLEADPDEWAVIIQQEIVKAKSAGFKPQVAAHGAGQQIQPAVTVTVREDAGPRDDEDAVTYSKRLRSMRQQR